MDTDNYSHNIEQIKNIADLNFHDQTLIFNEIKMQEQNLISQIQPSLKKQEKTNGKRFSQKKQNLKETQDQQNIQSSRFASNRNTKNIGQNTKNLGQNSSVLSFKNKISIERLYYLKGILISIVVFILLFIFFMILILKSNSSSSQINTEKTNIQIKNRTGLLEQKEVDHEFVDRDMKNQNQLLKKRIQQLKQKISIAQTKTSQKCNNNEIHQIDNSVQLRSEFKKDIQKFKLFNTDSRPDQQITDTLKFWKLTGNDISKSDELQLFQELQKNYYQKKYQISKYKEVEICVVVLSYMNKANDRYKRNLDSIIQQDYTNYMVYYVDDKSQDKTADLVQEYIKDRKVQDKIILYRNVMRKGKSFNQFYIGQQNCKPGSVMVVLDGDDELIGKQVFKFLSAAYQITGSYYIYTNFLMIDPINHGVGIGFSVPFSQETIKTRNYRHSILASHLRTWMSDLFLDIKKQDLLYKGDFPQVGQDLGTSFQLQQKAGTKVSFFSEYVYRYVTETGLNDYALNRAGQTQMDKHYRKMQKFDAYNKTITLNIKS